MDDRRNWLQGNPNRGLPESSGRRRRRQLLVDVDPFTAAASRPSGADPDAAAFTSDGRTAGPFTAGEALNPSNESLDEQSSRRRFRDELLTCHDPFPGEVFRASMAELNRRIQASAAAARSQASSSAAPPSQHPGAERTGRQTRIRQSALYADRPRRSRHRRSTPHVEHSSNVSSSELEVTNLPTFEALSVRDSSTASPPETEEHPREVSSELGGAVTDLPTLEALSLMSELPLLTPDETSEESDDEDVTEEQPREVSSSELGGAVTDLPTLEALSLSGPPPLTPQITSEETDDDDAYTYVDDDDVDDAPHEPIEFGIGTFVPQTLCYSAPQPRFKWLCEYDRGQIPLEELPPDPSSIDFDPSRSQKVSASDSDFDKEEELRLLSEYLPAHTCNSFREAFDRILAVEHAALTELAAKRGTEPPPPRQAKHLPVDQETDSLQAQQLPLSAAAQPQHSTAPRKPRCEASNAELAENAENWMREEVKMVFAKYIETRNDLKGCDCQFDEISHQCFNVENYNKIFHHYNFKARIKKPNSVGWVDALYFAEVKQIFGRKYYFCCRLEPNENGHCYACQSQSVADLQHPATGGFETGLPNVGFSLWYE